MPSINDMVQLAEAMEKSPIAVVKNRCVGVRNRNATCRSCIDVCQVGAIEIDANDIHFDAKLCVGCGACSSVCPTEALLPVSPTHADLARASAEAAIANEGVAVFACARAASKYSVNPALFAQVACLARMEESLPLTLVAHGATEILLVDADCSSCKYGSCDSVIGMAVERIGNLLVAHGCDVPVRRASEFPVSMVSEDPDGNASGSTRRGFFSNAASAAKDTVATAARTTLEQKMSQAGYDPPSGDSLHVTETGNLPQYSMPRHEEAINALDSIGPASVPVVDSWLFGTLEFDADLCNACRMCAVFCPSGALKRDPAANPTGPLKYLEFSACDCVQCGLCVDVCWKGALALSSRVPTEELYDFEPRTFLMKGTQRNVVS